MISAGSQKISNMWSSLWEWKLDLRFRDRLWRGELRTGSVYGNVCSSPDTAHPTLVWGFLCQSYFWPPKTPFPLPVPLASPPQTRLRNNPPFAPYFENCCTDGHRAKPTDYEMASRVLCQLSHHQVILWQWLTSSSLLQTYRVLTCNFKW